jgi:integrase
MKQPTFIDILRLAYSGSKDKSLSQRSNVLIELVGAKTPMRLINNAVVMNLIKIIKDRGITDSTLNRYLSILSKVVSVYRKAYDPTFALYIPWKQEGSGRFEWLRAEDEPKVHSYLKSKGMDDVSLCVSVLTITGMRLGELLSLEPTQIEDEWIRLWATKTRRPRSVPLPAGVGARLRALVSRGVPRGHTIRRGLCEALKASGVNSRITPHSLRHTTATRLIKSGVNVLTTARYLGHNSLKTTNRYVHIDDTDITNAMVRMMG